MPRRFLLIAFRTALLKGRKFFTMPTATTECLRIPCPTEFHSFMTGDAQTFSCRCGHREKLSAFQKRRSKRNQQKASRHDVNKYMKKNNDEEFTNTALADALKKLKK